LSIDALDTEAVEHALRRRAAPASRVTRAERRRREGVFEEFMVVIYNVTMLPE
jgi:hypothetical protein